MEQQTGVIEAETADEVRKKLRGMNIRAIEIKKQQVNVPVNLNISIGPVIDLKGLIIFTRQLSSLIISGVPLVTALKILADQERRPPFQKILNEIKGHVESGGGFSEVLQRYPRVFSEFFVRIVEAGEVSGSLDKSLVRVGQQLEKLNNIRRKVIGAMIYPGITLVVAGLVVAFLMAKVVPEIVSMYGKDQQLPDITIAVIGLSNWFRDFWWVLGLVVVFLGFGLKLLLQVPAVKLLWDPVVLKIPGFGLLVLRSGIAIFSRTLSTLVASGVQLLAAFEICEKVTSNTRLKQCIKNAANSVIEGQGIAAGLGKLNVIPPMVIHMINIGEMTGKLDEMLLKISEIYDEEVDDAVSIITSMIQPVLIVFVGGIIMSIMVAIYLPLFGMGNNF